VLAHLVHVCGERRSSLGVVTPYTAQLNLLSQQLAGLAAAAANAPPRPWQGLAGGSSTQQQQQQQQPGADESSTAAAAADVLEIKTVDGYQGREKEIVLFSAVRANAQAQVSQITVTHSMYCAECCCFLLSLLIQRCQGPCAGAGELNYHHTYHHDVMCRVLLLDLTRAVSVGQAISTSKHGAAVSCNALCVVPLHNCRMRTLNASA
jgi:hypothetical protein